MKKWLVLPIRTVRILIAVSACAVMVGCSGSSSSSGVGSPAATSYAGVYDGTLNFTARGFGVSVSDSSTYRVVVGVDGEVSDAAPGFSGTGSCEDNGESYYLTGNVLESSETINCSFPDLGTCIVEGFSRYVFNAAAGSLSGSATYFCQAGNFTATFSAYLSKVSS
jgi:hypothetical protein